MDRSGGIKASGGDSSREGIRKGLAQIAGQGFDGAMGAITFAGNDMRVPGKVVQWDGGEGNRCQDPGAVNR